MDLTNHTLGPYQLTREIGRGGMAVIYHATDTRTGGVAALKVLLPHLAHEVPTRRRFQQEGENAKRLIHPNVVRVFEAGESAGHYYIAMEYVPGGTVADRLKERGQPFTVDEALPILYQIAAALDYAHARNILHRDIKPSNLLLGDQGRALLSDFGIARPLAADYTVVTMTGFSVGTPAYMSPEQAFGEKNLTAQSDIYSLGVVAYNMLTLALPFDADTPLVLLRKIVDDRPVLPEQVNSSIKSGVSYAIQRVLAKTPERRYATATEFIYALEHGRSWFPAAEDWALLSQHVPAVTAPSDRVAATHRAPSRPATTYVPAPNPEQRRTRLTGSIIGALALLLVGLIGYTLYTAGVLPGMASQPRANQSSMAAATESAALPLPPTILRSTRDELIGFEIDIPTGWAHTRQGNALFFEAPDSTAWVLVERLDSAPSAQVALETYLAETSLFRAITQRTTASTQARVSTTNDYTQEIDASLLGGTAFEIRLRALQSATHTFIVGFGVKPPVAARFADTGSAILNSFVTVPLAVAAAPTVTVTLMTQGTMAVAATPTVAEPTSTPAHTATETPTVTRTQAPTATQTVAATATVAPTKSPTATQTPPPTKVPTHTPTSLPPTPTLHPTPSYTATPRPTATPRATATASPLPSATHTATLRPTSTPLPTSTPVPTPTTSPTAIPLPTATAPPTATARPAPTNTPPPATPTQAAPQAAFAGAAVTLLEPAVGDTLNSRRRFAWQPNFDLPPGYYFEPVFWQQGGSALGDSAGVGGSTTNSGMELQPDQFFKGPGDYYWGVLLVKLEPYTRVKHLGGEQPIRVETGSSGSGGSGDSGGGSGDPGGGGDRDDR